MTRRALLQRGAVLTAALGAPYVLRAGTAPAVALSAPFTEPLRLPKVLTGADLTIPVRQADVQILQGARTRMWTFAGEFPGPTIRRPAGASTRVTFRHRLPDAARSLTIHHHGHHNTAIDDGQPVGQFIAPGERRTYTYEHVEEGRPLRAAMRWYHDHSHGRTGLNSWMGLVGVFIVEDPSEAALGLPMGRRELVLVVTERSFDKANQLTDPFTGAADPSGDSVGMGDVLLVNGVHRPYVQVAPTTYRLRVLNAASFRPYNLGFADHHLVQVGNESGLFPAPLTRDRVLLGPAERADLIVDFSGLAGKDLVLRSTPQSGGPLGFAPAADTGVMQFRVRGRARPADPLAAKLRALPAWVDALTQVPDRVFAFGRGVASNGAFNEVEQVWTVNGKVFDPTVVSARPELGSTETWLLVNASQQSHYVHIHDVDWKLISRNGAAPDPWEDVLKETFRLDPGEVLAVGAKFTDHLGRFMVHCHMLSHEDHAMMTTFEVVPPGQGDRLRPGRVATSVPAVVRGRPVRAPLDDLTADEARRVAAMLAEQRRAPGRPATPPAAPLKLAPQALALCNLDRTTR